MSQYLFFVLLEADKVEVQVLYPVLLQQILPYQATQVDACLRQSIAILI